MIKKDAIFVSLASYRDDSCLTTLHSIFAKAKNPSNIYVGICQQNKPGDSDCLNLFEDHFFLQISLRFLNV